MKHIHKTILQSILSIMGFLPFISVEAQDIESHKWNERTLVIQSFDQLNSNYKAQLQEFKNADADFQERKLVIYEVIKDKYRFKDYGKSAGYDKWNSLTSDEIINLPNSTSFKITLIGLDGGIKLEQNSVLKKEILFALIDSMPMRKIEISNKKE